MTGGTADLAAQGTPATDVGGRLAFCETTLAQAFTNVAEMSGRQLDLLLNLTVLSAAVAALGHALGALAPGKLREARAALDGALAALPAEIRGRASVAAEIARAWDAALPPARPRADAGGGDVVQLRPDPRH